MKPIKLTNERGVLKGKAPTKVAEFDWDDVEEPIDPLTILETKKVSLSQRFSQKFTPTSQCARLKLFLIHCNLPSAYFIYFSKKPPGSRQLQELMQLQMLIAPKKMKVALTMKMMACIRTLMMMKSTRLTVRKKRAEMVQFKGTTPTQPIWQTSEEEMQGRAMLCEAPD